MLNYNQSRSLPTMNGKECHSLAIAQETNFKRYPSWNENTFIENTVTVLFTVCCSRCLNRLFASIQKLAYSFNSVFIPLF